MVSAYLFGVMLAQLRVTVTDNHGKILVGAKISIKNTEISGNDYNLTTDKKGMAIQTGMTHHVFMITIEKEGYQTYKTKYDMPAGGTRKVTWKLRSIKEVMKEQEANDPHAQAISKFNAAAALIEKKQYPEALILLEKAIELDANIYQTYYYQGVCYYETEKYKEAVGPLTKVTELKEDFAAAYRLLAAAYEKLGNKEQTEKYTKLAQKLGGKTALDVYNEGIAAFNAGNIDKAITSFEEAIKLDPKMADAYYQLGMNYLNKGQNDKAIACFKKYIEIAPNGKDAATAKSIIDTL